MKKAKRFALAALLALGIVSAILSGCNDDFDRSGYEATATASVWTEAEVAATETAQAKE